MKSLPCIMLMGPTAAGKTDLAVFLSEQLPCDIISVDSAMVYRGMNIGTAKPSAALLQRAPHRLIDICDPSEAYSAARFCEDALNEIRQIHARQRIPLLTGGTMLYFRALQYGLSTLPDAQPAIRERLLREAAISGWPALHQRLAEVDAISGARIHPNDTQRIQRALEVYEISGESLSTWQARTAIPVLDCPLIKLAVCPQRRDVLHSRIAQRFYQMLAEGLVEEVQQLYARKDLDLSLPALRSVGYRQVWQYLAGDLSGDQMAGKAITATRQLAKRQLTWLRADKAIIWFDSLVPDMMQKVLKYLQDSPSSLDWSHIQPESRIF